MRYICFVCTLLLFGGNAAAEGAFKTYTQIPVSGPQGTLPTVAEYFDGDNIDAPRFSGIRSGMRGIFRWNQCWKGGDNEVRCGTDDINHLKTLGEKLCSLYGNQQLITITAATQDEVDLSWRYIDRPSQFFREPVRDPTNVLQLSCVVSWN